MKSFIQKMYNGKKTATKLKNIQSRIAKEVAIRC